MKIAIISKAGLALGVVGTALGGTALGVAIKSKYDYDDGGYYSYGGGYDQGGWRRKRDLEVFLHSLNVQAKEQAAYFI